MTVYDPQMFRRRMILTTRRHPSRRSGQASDPDIDSPLPMTGGTRGALTGSGSERISTAGSVGMTVR